MADLLDGWANHRIGVVFTGTATMPILPKSIGRHRPQNRLEKSMRVCCRPGPALTLPARKDTGTSRLAGREAIQQVMRGMVPILSMVKVGRDRPQLCARESSPLPGDVSNFLADYRQVPLATQKSHSCQSSDGGVGSARPAANPSIASMRTGTNMGLATKGARLRPFGRLSLS